MLLSPGVQAMAPIVHQPRARNGPQGRIQEVLTKRKARQKWAFVLDAVNRVHLSSPGRARTYDLAVNSRSLYQLSYRGINYLRLPKVVP